ncbi:MAG TPA: glycosyltransferase [Candidatus Saccharimonadales bacterium]|jgi:glycosyltransferase involved in cell wall biosynthesis
MAVKVLHFSTHCEDCGIGKYQEMFLEAMSGNAEVQNAFFDVSPNKIRVMQPAEKAEVYQKLVKELADYDILHVQHEFSFYPKDEFLMACQAAKQAGKRLVVTVHTAPSVAFSPARRAGIAPRSVLHYLRARRKESFYHQYFVDALKLADLVLVHNTVTMNGLTSLGIDAGRIQQITIPVPAIDTTTKTTEIAEKLNRQPGDIIYSTTGFLHKFKGVDHAIKALSFLPPNYKLAIVGGMHQDHDHSIYNDLTDLIQKLGLTSRVYITGFIEDDNRLNALIRESDVCVYPYEKVYYSSVSSAALNNAFANDRPVIAYPTASFKQLSGDAHYMTLTAAFSYYELARELQRMDFTASAQKSTEFKQSYSYPIVARQLAEIYAGVKDV